jgi:hypothetical protein
MEFTNSFIAFSYRFWARKKKKNIKKIQDAGETDFTSSKCQMADLSKMVEIYSK